MALRLPPSLVKCYFAVFLKGDASLWKFYFDLTCSPRGLSLFELMAPNPRFITMANVKSWNCNAVFLKPILYPKGVMVLPHCCLLVLPRAPFQISCCVTSWLKRLLKSRVLMFFLIRLLKHICSSIIQPLRAFRRAGM